MTLCSPVCRRAVQRQITSHGEPIWISDDVLNRSYQGFLGVSKTAKRYGSFVPGPLESRRRLGRRRMAYAQASPPPSLGGIGALWGWFMQSDNTKYEWQAPTIRPPAEEPPDLVQDWLSGLSEKDISKTESSPHEPLDLLGGILEATSSPIRIVAAESLNYKLLSFRRSLWEAARAKNMENAIKSCETFTLHLEQSLATGETRATVLHRVLSGAVMKDICLAIPDLKASSLCRLALYEAIWEGISTCKVLDVNDFGLFGLKITRTLLRRLATHMDLPEARTLSSAILRSLPHAQQLNFRAPIRNVVYSWMKTWLEPGPRLSVAEETCYADIESIIKSVDEQFLSLGDLIVAASASNMKTEIKNLKATIQSTKAKMKRAIRAIDRLDNKSREHMESVADLAQALYKITNLPGYASRRQTLMRPAGVLRGVIISCSQQISTLKTVSQRLKMSRLLMNLVTLLPQAHDDLWYQVWLDIATYRKEMQVENFGRENRRPMPVFAQWILQRWIACKDIEEPARVSNEYALVTDPSKRRSYATLLLTVQKCGGDITNCYNQLLTFLVATGRPSVVLKIVSDLQAHQVRLLPQSFSRSLDIICQHHPELTRQCLKLYKDWLCLTPEKHHLGRPTGLRLEYCPSFVLSLIEKTTIPPKLIWELLDIPLCESLNVSVGQTKQHLEPEMVSLMERMAVSFSEAETRPQRVALRNVDQCLKHLVRHGVKQIPEGISRAITHSGLTRKLLENDGIIGLARVRWCVDKIGSIEGVEVAKSVDEQVYYYKQARLNMRAERRRVTRALPVDILDRRVSYVNIDDDL